MCVLKKYIFLLIWSCVFFFCFPVLFLLCDWSVCWAQGSWSWWRVAGWWLMKRTLITSLCWTSWSRGTSGCSDTWVHVTTRHFLSLSVTSLTHHRIKLHFLSRCEAECRLGSGSVWPLPLYDLPAEGGRASGHGHPARSLRRQEALRPATDTRVSMATELGWVWARDIWTEWREKKNVMN